MSKLHWLTALAVVGAAMVSGNSAAQPKAEFKITSFIPEKFKDFEWTVEGRGDLAGGSDRSEPNPYDYSREATSSTSTSNLHVRSEFNSRAVINSYTRRHALLTTIPLRVIYYYDRFTQHDSSWSLGSDDFYDRTTKSHSYYVELAPSIDDRAYEFGDWFVAVQGSGQLSYWHEPDQTTTDVWRSYDEEDSGYVSTYSQTVRTNVSQSEYDNWLRLTALIGFGRIYSGYFAATASYFVQDLRKRGLLNRELTTEEMLALTELIYQRRLQHAVDSRSFQLETVQMVLDFLQSKQLVDSLGPSAAVFDDVWKYYPKSNRNFGWQIRGGRGLEYEYRKRTYLDARNSEVIKLLYHEDSIQAADTLDYSHTSRSVSQQNTQAHYWQYLTLQAEYSMPISLKWQFDARVEGRAYINYTYEANSDDTRSKLRDKYYLYCSSSLVCFLDSRSNLSFTANADYRRQVHFTIDSQDRELSATRSKELQWSLVSRFQWRLSLPTTLEMSAQLSSNNNESRWEDGKSQLDRIQYALSVGLRHYIY